MAERSARMTSRIGAVAASVGLLAATVVAGAASAQAGQLDGSSPDAPAVVTIVPVEPQPVVAGHEGDVLLRVSVAMPGTKAPVAKSPAKKSHHAKKAARAKAPR